MAKIRGTHSSPGVYTQFTDLSYAAKTLGITTLGLVGETLKGPAFEPIMVSNFSEYRQKFGGTSAEKFKDTQYPKYELPYIAKSYLSASDQLYVCRVLGLSGYNAGPAFAITASKADGTKYVVAILRSRGVYKKFANIGTTCEPNSQYDTLIFDCDEIELKPYTNLTISLECGEGGASTSEETSINIDKLNYGQFTIVAKKKTKVVGTYAVSLNNGAKDYIYNVLGSKPTEGTASVFVEEFYDNYLAELLYDADPVVKIDMQPTIIDEIEMNAVDSPVADMVRPKITKSMVGKHYLCNQCGNDYLIVTGTTSGSTIINPDWNGCGYIKTEESGSTIYNMEVGTVYMPTKYNGELVYVEAKNKSGETIKISKVINNKVDTVKVKTYDDFFCLSDDGKEVETMHSKNMSDYHDQFRCATTPWIISELKGDAKHFEMHKLFRFHTISDGVCANEEVKVSISNIRPDEGKFDVIIRDYGDSDGGQSILETYKDLTMVPGDPKYIGLQIGTLNGDYELKSKYVMVEVIESDITERCVPAGFLGYPTREYPEGIEAPTFTYNKVYDDEINVKKQFFGLSDLTGVDVDMLYYKGKNAYGDYNENGYTACFHLDSRLDSETLDELKELEPDFIVTVDGEKIMKWDTVLRSNVTSENKVPKIDTESEMEGTIYEDTKLRKFTVYPYGGFDGWDIYRNQRTTGDEFKANKYKGQILNGYGKTFSKISNGSALALSGNCITSDYYAFLAGANQFEIVEKYLINLFATPGIDYVSQNLLSREILEMIEEKRGDTFYVMTTPDKPVGASDAEDEMYTSSDASGNLDDANIDTYFAGTYYPWVKFYDADNSMYINLPATKDALRNMANIDNKRYPWYAPAGIERGDVDCKKMHFFAKLEDEDNVYDGRINPLKTFSKDGVKIWGNKTMYSGNTPMNRINVVRLMLYMRKLIIESTRTLIFEPNDTTLKGQFESIVNPILTQIKKDRGITDFKLKVSQTPEEMDEHELNCELWVKPTPTLEYIQINFMVTPQGVEFESI